jgi:hypothetical protein
MRAGALGPDFIIITIPMTTSKTAAPPITQP